MGTHLHHLEPASPSPGTRHFLLFCSVRPEDKGIIRFVAGTAVSEANLWVEGTGVWCKGLLGSTIKAEVHKGQLMGFPWVPA